MRTLTFALAFVRNTVGRRSVRAMVDSFNRSTYRG